VVEDIDGKPTLIVLRFSAAHRWHELLVAAHQQLQV
jgi:hypothetical protein